MSANFAAERFTLLLSLTDIQFIILVVGVLQFLLCAAKTSTPSSPPSGPICHRSLQPLQKTCSLSTGDSAVVLRSLGMLAGGDLLEMFEEENPSLAEAKEAFDVFDEDRDGFIKMKLENCRRMIALGDEDGDGRIDFEEFLRFMERNLC